MNRRGFTLGQRAIAPTNLNLVPQCLVTAAVCSIKNLQTVIQGTFWRGVGVVDLVVLTCGLRATIKRCRQGLQEHVIEAQLTVEYCRNDNTLLLYTSQIQRV